MGRFLLLLAAGILGAARCHAVPEVSGDIPLVHCPVGVGGVVRRCGRGYVFRAD